MEPEPIEEHEDQLLTSGFVLGMEDQAAISKGFDGIKGYKIQTDLDRNLLLGIWKHEKET